jgi:hypothetical protein
LARISVHSAAWSTAKPATSHKADFGSVACAVSHAANRRIDSLRRERAAAGKMDAVDMGPCVARFWLMWNRLDVKKAL